MAPVESSVPGEPVTETGDRDWVAWHDGYESRSLASAARTRRVSLDLAAATADIARRPYEAANPMESMSALTTPS